MPSLMSKTLIRTALALAAALAICATSAPARADKCSDAQDASDDGGQNYRTVIGPDGRKVFVIEKAFVVCGKVPKPAVIYVLQASTINYEWETLKQDFLPKIRNSVNEAPF